VIPERGRPPFWRAASGVAALFLAFHLRYLPRSLEDVDSINFALGVRQFDVAHHQPHPPGYPVFILMAKAAHLVVPSEARALAGVGILASTLAVFALVAFFTGLDRVEPDAPGWALCAAILTVSAPLYWLTAARPLSDATGLAAAMAIQALTLAATGIGALIASSFLAAVAVGIRSQVAWLTIPLLVLVIARRHGKGGFLWPIVAFLAGGLAWGIPLVVLTGGPATYRRALFNQGSEDLSNIVMLWTTRTPRELASALYYAFLAAWAVPAVAAIILALSVLGIIHAFRRRPAALVTLGVAFGPYLLFDLVFQETITTRYALPLIVPMAYLATRGAAMLGPASGVAAVVGLSMFDAHVGGVSLAAYSRQPAPVFRMLDGMKTEASIAPVPVLAMHRREDLDLRRPLAWAGPPPVAARLAAPAKREWLELVNYWTSGGRRPVWFVADPLRSDLALVGDPQSPERFRWALDYPVLLGGIRPDEMDWYVLSPPDWYLGEGWALTPETAGIAREDRRGPGYAPIHGWIRRWVSPATLMIGGRNLASGGGAADLRVEVDGRLMDRADVAPGFFLRMIDLPANALSGESDYAPVTVSASSDNVAIEQFDARTASNVVFGYGDGWHEQEYTPSTGQLWRWTSDHATLRLRTDKQALVLSLEGEVEAASRSHVTIRLGTRIVAAYDIGRTFAIRQAIPKDLVNEGDNTITITTDQTYVPAERHWRTRDRRLLGLKVYECRITPAS
jgi:hypothetical protein